MTETTDLTKTHSTLSVTVHPVELDSSYLGVKDALGQILDLVSILEETESNRGSERKIEWKLTNAFVNSPPLTIEITPTIQNESLFNEDPVQEVIRSFESTIVSGLKGEFIQFGSKKLEQSYKKFLRRQTEDKKISQTVIAFEDSKQICITEEGAKIMQDVVLKKAENIRHNSLPSKEIGSIQGRITGIALDRQRPALKIIDRVSGKDIVCVLSNELSEEIGALHHWKEVWEGRQVSVEGFLSFDKNGNVSKAEIDQFEEIEWNDVSLEDLRQVDILQGRSIAEHKDEIEKLLDE